MLHLSIDPIKAQKIYRIYNLCTMPLTYLSLFSTKKLLLTHYPMIFITTILFLMVPYTSPLQFDYPTIKETDPYLTARGNISYLGSEIQLTTNQTDQIGRLTYFQPLQLWDISSGRLMEADFTTKFSFTIYSNDTNPGDGLAFFLGEPPFKVPLVTDNASLGLIRPDQILSSDTSFVAVEFDTFPNDQLDPPDLREHVGINVDSMVSMEAAAWPVDFRSWPPKVYNATVSYDSTSKMLTVLFTEYDVAEGFTMEKRLSIGVNLTTLLPEQVVFGFSAANGLYTSKHVIHSWSFSSEFRIESTNIPDQHGFQPKNLRKDRLLMGLIILGSLLFVTIVFTLYFFSRCKKCTTGEKDHKDHGLVTTTTANEDQDLQINCAARKFSYYELCDATNNFAEEEKLRQEGLGGVYRGFLKDEDSYVAIKMVSKSSSQGLKEYTSELKIISELWHKNIVQLIGWCHHNELDHLLLVYEFMINGSLDAHLFRGESSLTWFARYNIARGLASALLYLHEECERCVLHTDIKSSNVMLDSNFNAKLGDFGLARLYNHDTNCSSAEQSSMFSETLGYLAPEYITTKTASKASDVFSFGVVMLEIASGKQAGEHSFETANGQVSLVEWVWDSYEREKLLDVVDKRLCKKFDVKETKCLLIVGLWCVHPDHNLRPSIRQAVQVLNFDLPCPDLPKRPTSNYYVPVNSVALPTSEPTIYCPEVVVCC
uniref:non-specific serine/threonine protein kinase n=1 Tax=Parasponia rigida TaxID=3477 RepID=A0A221I0U1_PARRI|nr:lectin receptor kinase protein 1 [Parasponia rigida]